MEKKSAVILAFPPAAAPLPSEITCESVHSQMDKTGADLAIVSEELSQRLAQGQSKPLALHQVNVYKQKIAQVRTLLQQLEQQASQLQPDSSMRDRI